MSEEQKNPESEEAKKAQEEQQKTSEDQNSTEEKPSPEKISEEENLPSNTEQAVVEEVSENTEENSDKTEETPVKAEENEDSSKDKDVHEEMDDSLAEDSEDEENGKRHDIEMKDYHAMNMGELVSELSRLVKNEKIQAIREHVQEIKTEFDAKFEEEMEQKKEDFLEEGGNIIDFHYSSPVKKEFNTVYFDYKEKRNKYYQELKQNLNENLKQRLGIIEELKGMIGVGADMNSNFQQFKELQDRWKKAGPVPREEYKDIWRTYHHHVEHFYDFLHLDREFRDMDFKHNLEQKLKIIARAEELAQEKNINRAFRELQMLHKMWKEDLGPVAKEYREDIWDKFSEATKQIHENRQAHFAELDKEKEKNLEVKQDIIKNIEEIAEQDINAHNQAQQNIKKIENLRESFFKAGKVPRNVNEETWSAFKEAVRKFNRKKNAFYKNLKKDQYENLEKKLALVEIAEKHQDSEDYKEVTPIMKKIQDDWKKIGHVPRKDSDKIWKRFKKACNHYFDKMHASRKEENKEELEAFDNKKELLEETKNLELSGEHKKDLSTIKEQIAKWKELGRVPYNKRYIEGKFNKALDHLFSQLDVDKKQAEMMKYENRIQALDEADDDRKIEKEEFFLRKKITETKAEINQLENNMQFFSNADESNPLVKEVINNIKRHKEQLATWKEKLKKVRSL
ncbi:DUF349 domain-containing protein [Mesonia maritima]|uniref:Chromosome segregation protein n=1 Tax=Mesonia maritima TaxID=1793873 RepID=A0ABU1K4A1_9FLAO|nr:DUF349 domain-containing protein [Mesonia maritima]MDR6300440.1 hypothetical protein [Mesonia maritima]